MYFRRFLKRKKNPADFNKISKYKNKNKVKIIFFLLESLNSKFSNKKFN
jgi:hypothetical protein